MNYTSIKNIMARLMRHPLMQDLNLEAVVDYAVDFMRIVGVPKTFIEKTEVLDIVEYRAELPCDFYKMIQIRPYDDVKGPDYHHAYRYTTDSFHMSNSKSDFSDITYKMQGNCLFFSTPENGKVEIAYKAFPVDSDGCPLIPDDGFYARALEAYIKKIYFGILFDQGKINGNVMARTDQEYAWNVGQAQAEMIMPSIDEMESLTNMWNRFVDVDQHRHGFLHEGTQEHWRIHH